MKRFKRYLPFVLMLLMMFSFTTFATSEGEVYQKEDGYYYQMIDGREFRVDNGSAGDGSISDAFKNYSSTNTPDADAMNKATEKVNSTVGVVLSAILYIFFVLIGFTTACDLLYIALPPVRPLLYDGKVNQQQGQGRGVQQ